LVTSRLSVQGIATSDYYGAQGEIVCSGAHKPTTAGMWHLRQRTIAVAVFFDDELCTDNVQRFAAAAGDISNDISPDVCDGSS